MITQVSTLLLLCLNQFNSAPKGQHISTFPVTQQMPKYSNSTPNLFTGASKWIRLVKQMVELPKHFNKPKQLRKALEDRADHSRTALKQYQQIKRASRST